MSTTPHEISRAWQRERPGTSTRSIPVVTALKRTAKQLQQVRERILRDLGIDAATLDLLSALKRAGDPYTLSTRELAGATYVTAGAISQRVARAENAGLVQRRPASHGRTVLVDLTPEGHALVERSVDAVLASDDAAIAPLADDELRMLEHLLAKLAPPTPA